MPRLMVIYDIHIDTPQGRIGWAYWRRACALQWYAPPGWEVEIAASESFRYEQSAGYDAIFVLDYASINVGRMRQANRKAVVIASFNSDENRRRERFDGIHKAYDFTIINNRAAWESYGRREHTACISNGVCLETFRPTTPIIQREHRAFWTGSDTPAKGKGIDLLRESQPDLERRGFICDFRPISSIRDQSVAATADMVAAYDASSYVICMSKSDATPNTTLEGGAMGCVPVSTKVGNILEFGVNGQNCVLVERTVDGLIDGLERARENRQQLSDGISETMQGWGYGAPGHRAQHYFAVFTKLLNGGLGSIAPFYFGDRSAA